MGYPHNTRPVVIGYMQRHPNQPVHIKILAEEMGLVPSSVSAALGALTANPQFPVDRVASGTYRYTPPAEGPATPVQASVPVEPPVPPAPVSPVAAVLAVGDCLEIIGFASESTHLARDVNGAIWQVSKLKV